MKTIDAKQDFVAIGRLAYTLRVQVRDIEAACQRLGLSGALRMNGVLYLDGETAAKIKTELRNQ